MYQLSAVSTSWKFDVFWPARFLARLMLLIVLRVYPTDRLYIHVLHVFPNKVLSLECAYGRAWYLKGTLGTTNLHLSTQVPLRLKCRPHFIWLKQTYYFTLNRQQKKKWRKRHLRKWGQRARLMLSVRPLFPKDRNTSTKSTSHFLGGGRLSRG